MLVQNFSKKNTRLARDMAILVIFHKIGVGDSRFFPRGFRGKMGGLGWKKNFAPKICSNFTRDRIRGT